MLLLEALQNYKMQVVANSINDPMLRYNCASLTANAAEKVKILAENG
jgi:hypothetical protein